MRERNDTEIRPVCAQTHRGDDIFGVGGKLFRCKGDETGIAGCGGGEFEVNNRWRWIVIRAPPQPGLLPRGGEGGRRLDEGGVLSNFKRTGDFVFAPRGEQLKDKFRRMTLRKDRAGRRNFFIFTRSEEFGKRPALAGSEIAQGDFISAGG